MGNVFEINQKRLFTLEDARVLLPIVRRVTRNSLTEMKTLTAQLSLLKDNAKKAALEEQIQHVCQAWHAKIRKLGAEAKGLWLVDFDTGEGYYCWHYPESDIEYYHAYSEGFKGRVKLDC